MSKWGEGLKNYRDAGGRKVEHRLQVPRQNVSEVDLPMRTRVLCMCGSSHEIEIKPVYEEVNPDA